MNLDTFLDLLIADQQANPHAVHVVDDLERVCARIANDANYPDKVRTSMAHAATRLRDALREMPDD